jgi:tRNA pseudouridine55 synthase
LQGYETNQGSANITITCEKTRTIGKRCLQMIGLIVLNKPGGISSAAAVNRVKRLLPRGVKIGHAGTLDPFATGVLLLLIGKATRLSSNLMNQAKGYDATIKLGGTTATDDPESPEIPTPNATNPSASEIEAALKMLTGEVSQRPPAFSALKVGGRPAYQLARAGKPPELRPRIVRVDSIQIFDWQPPLLKVHVECGRGTYIRAIARDLGELLQTGGYLTELSRTHIGSYDLAQAVEIATLESDGVAPHLKPIPSPVDPKNA